MHLGFAILTVLLFVLSISFGAAAFGKRFRIYSIATIILLAIFGILTSLDAPRVQADLPTPLAGIWERINIAVYLLWVIALSVMLLQRRSLLAQKDLEEKQKSF